jgi:hypothetical protein
MLAPMNLFDVLHFSELIFWLCDKTSNKVCRSYAGLSRRLELKSPRTLAMVAKRQRPPSFSLVQKIGDYLEATPQERDFLLLLAEKSRCEFKNLSVDKVEKKLDLYRQIKNENVIALAGVRIEFANQINHDMRSRLEEALRTVVLDLENLKKIGQ